jgi:nicotinamidase/pyrazinamidase
MLSAASVRTVNLTLPAYSLDTFSGEPGKTEWCSPSLERFLNAMSKKALLVVDIQNDFCPGGALGIVAGDSIIPALNRYIRVFSRRKLPVIATRDWHPRETKHFMDFGGVWPIHCVQGTRGSAYHSRLTLPKQVLHVYKGMDPTVDSYSAFQAKDTSGIPLPQVLKKMGIRELYIGGLATDYCVKHTVFDALRAKFCVRVLIDAVRGVNLKPHDAEEALQDMVARGAEMITSRQLKGE